jgi:hypothetical protein
MASTGPKYYRPYYPSDSEESDASADDSDAESQLAQETQDLPNFASFAQGLFRAAGPPFVTEEDTIEYSLNTLDRRTIYGPMVEAQEGYTTSTTTSQIDNIIVLQSLDRDKAVYPQPINCQLMLPRTYVNVTRFEIADISFIASFFYFRADKFNTTILYQESGRATFAPVLTNPAVLSPTFNLTLTIREGTYNIDTLLNELTLQFNTPPLFYDFINGFTDFYGLFINDGDHSVNFNYPGDFYYDAVAKVYITNPTTDQIVSYYFQQRYATPTVNNSYTPLQVKVAYYYPVVKELLLDVTYQKTATTPLVYLGSPIGLSVTAQLIHNFAGLDDPYMTDILGTPANVAILDAYRLAHTFRYYPVNRYICTYSTQTNYVCIQSTSLNTSLTSLLNATYSNFVNKQIQQLGITLPAYTSSAVLITTYKSILYSMYSIIQTNLAKTFGVNFGDLPDSYFINFSNTILLKNGKNATNVSYNFIISSNSEFTTNVKLAFRPTNTTYWENMRNISPLSQAYCNVFITSNSGVNVYSTKNPFSTSVIPYQDSNGNTYINPVEFSSDIIVKIRPGAYTIIPISSSLRQTAQVTTLPRASAYLYPEWNSVNGISDFSFPYTHAFPTGTDIRGIGSNISYPLSPALVDLGRITTLSETTLRTFSLNPLASESTAYFSFTTPQPVQNVEVYKRLTAVSIFPGVPIPVGDIPPADASGNTFPDSMTVFIYHDQAAFFADVGPVGQEKGESPFFYKYKAVINAGESVKTIKFSSYEDEVYYVYCRATDRTSFSTISFTIVPFVTVNEPTRLSKDTNFDPRLPSFNPYVVMQSNFYVAKVHDPDYIRLPIIDSNGYYYKTSQLSPNIGFLPSASNSPASAPINILLQKAIVALGYFSNVSDNLTDYIPIVDTFPPRALDITNNYQFRYTPDVSSYDLLSQTYLIGKSANLILSSTGSVYSTPNQGKQRYRNIVHYTGTHYIPTDINEFTQPNDLLSSNLKSFDSNTIPGLLSPFELNATGPCGMMFMPENGTWNIQRLTFLGQSSTTSVHFLAIYPTGYVNSNSGRGISLSNALCICVLTSSNTYYDSPAITGVSYGTYYTYTNVLTLQSNYVISGRIQNSPILLTDTNSYYSALAYSFSNPATLSNRTFTLSDFLTSKLTVIENLTGSCIPYPDLGFYLSYTFYDGKRSPDGNKMILSSNNPLTSIQSNHYINPITNPNFMFSNFYTSQYARSSPIVNSHLHYILQPSPTSFIFPVFYIEPAITSSVSNVHSLRNGTLILQTSNLFLYSYQKIGNGALPDTILFTPQSIITLETIFPGYTFIPQSSLTSNTPLSDTKIVLLTQSSFRNSIYFLGLRVYSTNYDGPTNTQFVIFKYTPSTGESIPYAYVLPMRQGQADFHPIRFKISDFFVYDNGNGDANSFWITFVGSFNVSDPTGTANYSPGILTSRVFETQTQTYKYFDTVPDKPTSIHMCVDPNSASNVYWAISRVSNPNNTFPIIYYFRKQIFTPKLNPFADIFNFDGIPIPVHPTTIHFSVLNVESIEYLYQIRLGSRNVYMTDMSTRITYISTEELPAQPVKCFTGASNEIWFFFNTPPYLMLHTHKIRDFTVEIAWQQLFPVMKIELIEVAEQNVPLSDTYNVSVPDWKHSVAFGYSNVQSLQQDIYSPQPLLKWGRESQYQVADTSFEGFYFNSYLGNIPLQNSTSYVALRGFSPTESYETIVRISLPNVYDFGYVTINQMISEIQTLSTSPGQFSAAYAEQLSTFDGLFVRSNADSFYGVSSFSVPTTGFSNFITQYSTLFGEYIALTSNANIINSNVRTSMQNFILTEMQYILPSNVLTRTRFTDSLTFSFLWKTALLKTPPSYANLVDGWGIGWNLGYAKQDDSYPSTVHFAPCMFKIVDDFLYLRLNPEFNLNRMSAGTKENYLDSREPSGLTSYYYCKLLLNGYGQTATTFVHSPIVLNPPIARISKISFEWLDSKGNLLNIPSATDSDWQMTVNIQENVQVTTFTQTSNLTASQYLAPGSKE